MTQPVSNPVCSVCHDYVDVNDPNTIPHDGGEAHRIDPGCLKQWLQSCREEELLFSCPSCRVILGVDIPKPLENPDQAIRAASTFISIAARGMVLQEVVRQPHDHLSCLVAERNRPLSEEDKKELGSQSSIDTMWASRIADALLANGPISKRDRGEAVGGAVVSGNLYILNRLLANGPISIESRGWAVAWAALRNFGAIVDTLLANGPISKKCRGMGVKHAAEKRYAEILHTLLSNGTITKFYRGWAAQMAAGHGDEASLRLLLADGSIETHRNVAVREAAIHGHEACLRLLLKSGPISEESRSYIVWCTAATNPAFKQVATNDASEAKLDQSASGPNDEDIARALDRGERIDMAKPQQVICHPFECRVSNGHSTCLNLLLESGPISEKYRGMAVKDAAARNDVEILSRLLANGPISEEDRSEAVNEAVEKGYEAIVDQLLAKGPISPGYRTTAIREAAKKNHWTIVHALLANRPGTQ
ncbi:MAG: hypothetical protein KGJ02_01890 [Verrucomicrobiota bacterium]|nr:hypothetical protein [Verrucomicrobiota bacterium]